MFSIKDVDCHFLPTYNVSTGVDNQQKVIYRTLQVTLVTLIQTERKNWHDISQKLYSLWKFLIIPWLIVSSGIWH